MRIGVIGGTKFVGRAFSEAALAAGHELVLFHRGQTGPDLFPNLLHIQGDRNRTEDLERLAASGPFEAVLDTCGYFPRQTELSTHVLRDRARQYLFVSSVSVYEPDPTGVDEDSPVATIEDASTEEIDAKTYGPLKALAEAEVRSAFGVDAMIVRPGLIVGPHDPTGRFTYWIDRVSRGGEVLAPGDGDDMVQFIDVRDLAAWMVAALERGLSGVYNANGPGRSTTWRQFLTVVNEELGQPATFRWAPAAWLDERSVQAWIDMPAWFPRDHEAGPLFAASNAKAVDAGLGFRPIPDTVRDTMAWLEAESGNAPITGMTPEREAELLVELG